MQVVIIHNALCVTFYVTSDVLETTHMNSKPNIFFSVDIKQ